MGLEFPSVSRQWPMNTFGPHRIGMPIQLCFAWLACSDVGGELGERGRAPIEIVIGSVEGEFVRFSIPFSESSVG